MKLHILQTPFSKLRASKVKAVAHLTQQEITQVTFEEKSGVTKNAAFPILPLLETAQGVISTSNAIIRYLANVKGSHYGANHHEQALVDQWIDIIAYDFEAAVYAVLVVVGGNDVESEKLHQDIKKFLGFLQNHLNGKTHLVGNSVTIADVSLVANLTVIFTHYLGAAQRQTYPHLTAYYTQHVASLSNIFGKNQLPQAAHAKLAVAVQAPVVQAPVVQAPVVQAPVQTPKPVQAPKPADDDIDLFGQAEQKKPEPPKAPVQKKPQAKKKKQVIAKSIVMFDVKVYEQETNLQELAQKIYTEVTIDGLTWNREHKILPVAFGMNKLQLGCVIEDAKVSTDDIFQKIEAWDEIVQSIDIVAFQKV